MKHTCVTCGQLAVWEYMPGYGGRRGLDDYYCDEHVSRGCSCNYDEETGVETLGDDGRRLPCCEYGYNGEGFDIEQGADLIGSGDQSSNAERADAERADATRRSEAP